jgi:hypothetical protein
MGVGESLAGDWCEYWKSWKQKTERGTKSEEKEWGGSMATERKRIVREIQKVVADKSTKIVTSISHFFPFLENLKLRDICVKKYIRYGTETFLT